MLISRRRPQPSPQQPKHPLVSSQNHKTQSESLLLAIILITMKGRSRLRILSTQCNVQSQATPKTKSFRHFVFNIEDRDK